MQSEARGVGDARLLDAWERARSLGRPWREIALLADLSGEPADELARLPVGERDRRLLALRERAFGTRIECETRCPACDVRLELEVETSAILARPREPEASAPQVTAGAWAVRFRSPNSVDVAECGRANGGAGAALLERCVVDARRDGVAVTADALPAELRELVAARMAERDPEADVSIDLDCSECGHRWAAVFDPAAFLWSELDAYADGLFAEVHRLARAYGWSEAEILALGPQRRRRYLELASE